MLLVSLWSAGGRLDAAEPRVPAPAPDASLTTSPNSPPNTSNDLDQARVELARIQARQQALDVRAAEIRIDEQRLDTLVQQLKQPPSGLPESLQKLRLDRALRQLRDRLVELQAVRREQRQLDDREKERREQLGTLLRAQANRGLADAERAFTEGREQEANALYHRALAFMQESERMAHPLPPPARDVYDFNPELTGSEEPAELIQLSVLLRHEAEELNLGLTALRQRARQLQTDLAFERRAARFQGIRDRGAEATVEPRPTVTPEAGLERQLTEVRNQISQDQARIRHLLERVKELETLAAGRARRQERPAR